MGGTLQGPQEIPLIFATSRTGNLFGPDAQYITATGGGEACALGQCADVLSYLNGERTAP